MPDSPSPQGETPLQKHLKSRPLSATTDPQAPSRDIPDVRESESKLLRTAIERFELSTPGAEAGIRGAGLAAKVRARPADIPADVSLMQQVDLALTPRQVRGDRRPQLLAEAPQYLKDQAKSAVITTVDPLGVWRGLGAFSEERQGPSGMTMPETHKGLDGENQALWALRVLGSSIPALMQETLKRTPTPDAAGAAKVAAEQGAIADVAAKFFSRSSLSEQLLGFEPDENQRIKRPNPIANWAQGILEKIEKGDGFEKDMELAFKHRVGEDWGNTGWWLGFAVDTLTNWEGAFIKGSTALPKLVSRASALGEVAPELSKVSRYFHAMKGTELEGAEWFGGKMAERLIRGEIGLDDLPDEIRGPLEEYVLREHEMTASELMRGEGIRVGEEIIDPEFAKTAEGLAAARAEMAAASREAKDKFAPRPTRERGAKGERPKRVLLPEFGTPAATATDFWDKVVAVYRGLGKNRPELGFSIPRGLGFQRIANSADQSIDDAVYILRNASGDVIKRGPFDVVAEGLLREARDGDEIWYANQRPVARWRKTADKPKAGDKAGGPTPGAILGADRDFASPVERAVIKRLREVDPRAIPNRVRQKAGAKLGEDQAALGKVLADILSRSPQARLPDSDAARAVVEATRIAMLHRMETSRFKFLPNGAMVPATDRAGYITKAHKLLGMNEHRAVAIATGAKQTEAEVERIAALANRYGVDTSNGFTPQVWRELRNGAFREVAGVVADVRYRIQGTSGLVDRLFGAFSDVHLDRRKIGRIGKILKRSPLAWFTRAFLEDKLARMPGPVGLKWKELTIRLGRNPDDMMQEYALIKEGTRAEKLMRLIGNYSAVHPEQAELSAAMLDKPSSALAEQLIERMPVWEQARFGATKGSGTPRWADWDPVARVDMAVAWARRTKDEAVIGGQEWIRTTLATAGHNMSQTGLNQRVGELKPELALRVYDEVFRGGKLHGPALQEAFGELKVGPVKVDETDQLITHAARMRARWLVDETMGEVLGTFAVAQGDPRTTAIGAVLHGTHKVWNPENSRWDYTMPEAQVTWALGKVRDWGIDPGAGAATKVTRVGRRQVEVPEYIANDLQRMISAGTLDSRTIYGSEGLDHMLRWFKEWTTHGVILPNPPYFMGQMLSVWPTLLTTRGLTGAAQTGSQLFLHPFETAEMMKRMSGGPTFAPRGPGSILVTASGEMYTWDELVLIAKRYGLQETPTSFETGRRFRELVMADGSDYAAMDPRRLKSGANPFRWWQQQLREWGGVFDQSARVATFIADVKRGVPPEQAADAARAATLDFRALTDWEGRYMRKVFTFYAFMRKNSDAYIRALFHNPERVLGQMRLAHASLTNSGLSDLELANMNESDMARLVLYDDEQVVNDNGRVHNLYRMNRLSSTPLGVIEAMLTLRSFMGADMPQLMQSFNPLFQTLGVVMMGRRLDRDFDTPHANRIPPMLVEMPGLGPWIRETFGIGPVPLRAWEDTLLADDDATAEIGAGEPGVWAAGGDPTLTPEQRHRKRMLWQTFRAWVSRPLGTAEQLSQALSWQQVSPTMTQEQQRLAAALGLRWVPVANEQEAVRRGLAKRERRFEETEVELRIPDRTR